MRERSRQFWRDTKDRLMILQDIRANISLWISVSLGVIATNFAVALLAIFVADWSHSSVPPGFEDWGEAVAIANMLMLVPVAIVVSLSMVAWVIAGKWPVLSQLSRLGASPGQLTRMVTGQFIVLALAGGALGAGLAIVAGPTVIDWVWFQIFADLPASQADLVAVHDPVPDRNWVMSAVFSVFGTTALMVLAGFERIRRLAGEWPARTDVVDPAKSGFVMTILRYPLVCAVLAGMWGLSQTIRGDNDPVVAIANASLGFFALVLVLVALLRPILARVIFSLALITPAWLAPRRLLARSNEVGSIAIISAIGLALPFGLSSVAAVLSDGGIATTDPWQAYVIVFGLPAFVAISGALIGAVATGGQRSDEADQLRQLGMTGGQHAGFILAEAVILAIGAGVLAIGMAALGSAFTAWAVSQLFTPTAMSLDWEFFLILFPIVTVIIVGSYVLTTLLAQWTRARSSQ